MIGAWQASTPGPGEVTTAAFSKVCLPARRIAGRFLRSKVRDRQMRIRALQGSCPAILPTASDLSSYISVTVPQSQRLLGVSAASRLAGPIWHEAGEHIRLILDPIPALCP